MRANSIEYHVDVQLFSKLCSLFEKHNMMNPEVAVVTRDYGKWEHLSIQRVYQMITGNCTEKELRTLAFWGWQTGFESADLEIVMLRHLAKQPGMDVFLEASVFCTSLCTNEAREVLRKSLGKQQRGSALEYLIAAVTILQTEGECDDVSLLVTSACKLLLDNEIYLTEDVQALLMLARMSDKISEYKPALLDALYTCSRKIPRARTKFGRECMAYGMDETDCFVFAMVMQRMSDTNLIRFSKKWDQLRSECLRLLLHRSEPWSNLEKSVLQNQLLKGSVIDSDEVVVYNDENFYWLSQISGLVDDSWFNFENERWLPRFASLERERGLRLIRLSCNIASEYGLKRMTEEHPEILEDAFACYDGASMKGFRKLVAAGFFNEVGMSEEQDLYWAKVFSDWTSRKSLDFARFVNSTYGFRSKQMCFLFKDFDYVGFDFLNEDERNELFDIANDYVFHMRPRDYYGFVKNNVEVSWLAADIMKSAEEEGDSDAE